MERKILSSAISLVIGIFLFFIGVKGLWPDFIINQEGQIGAGIFLTVLGFVMLLWHTFFSDRDKKILLYIGIITGILLVLIGLFLLWNNSPFWASVISPGIIIFLPNYIALLRKKFPKQEFLTKNKGRNS